MLDEVSPDALQPCLGQVLEQLRWPDGLKAFQRLSGRTLVALNGTEYCSPAKAELPAKADAQATQRQDGALSHHAFRL
jgi:hypothetical protein